MKMRSKITNVSDFTLVSLNAMSSFHWCISLAYWFSVGNEDAGDFDFSVSGNNLNSCLSSAGMLS